MSEKAPRRELPVIAIGASAGGLGACRALIKDMPGESQAALILIQHLDPKHDSLMVDLLGEHTQIEVVQAGNGMALRAGVLHVIPPGVFLTVEKRVIRFSDPDGGKGVRLPFDALLRSLAEDGAKGSACVILSGTGSDGSLGLADFKAAGGAVIAQDPVDAEYGGMPESAIATGLVDQTLRADQMVAALAPFMGDVAKKSPAKVPVSPKADLPAGDAANVASFDALLKFVDENAAQEIALYKRGTLERRVMRRMALVGLGQGDVAAYLERLRSDPVELSQLSADMLIHVTSFFRDPAVFDHLLATALPKLIETVPADQPLRIWVAGCSTGEEAYSLAIVSLEAMEAAGSGLRVQILASDIDPDAVATARAGFFSRDIRDSVSPQRLARFFVAEDGGYRVAAQLRDMIVFTVADLLTDPPFSKIDMVTCRNVLIYFGPEAQKRVIARCAFALRPGGFLLLGAAEMPGLTDKSFAVEHKQSRLWRRVGQSPTRDLHFTGSKREETLVPKGATAVQRGTLADLCRRFLLENYAPAAVLMNHRLECLFLLGPTEKYLRVPQSHPDPGVIGMLPKAMRLRVKVAAAACNASNPRVVVPGTRSHGTVGFNLVLHHLTAGTESLILVCFVDVPQKAADGAGAPSDAARPQGELESDLEAARSELADALRHLEQEVEAHSADTAEALSVNEEFQSTNEELLASKEELQSLNEELTALNSQLQETLERHRTTANDLQNVLFSTDVATLFLDPDLKIRFFTPAARAIFRVIATDVGRPLADLAAVAKDDDLAADARAVLSTNVASEREAPGLDRRWFQRRIQPYRAEGGRVEGVVITYIDITERKRITAALVTAKSDAERATKAKSRFLAAASHDLRQPLQSMALLHKLMEVPKRSTEGVRLARLLDQTLTSMTAMLDSMLDVNRIETGIVRPEMQAVPIGPLMQRLADEFGPQCGLKRLTLRSVPCTAWVHTDPQLLEQILRNLLSNALKYTPKGGILMGCRRRGSLLTLLVCDNGIGIAEAERAMIFDPYRQGEQASSFAEHGLGLGLSIVQRLAELLDHPIAVLSAPGKGSSFTITMKVAEPVTDTQDSVPSRPSIRSARQKGTILMVEDEESLRDLLAEVLEQDGHKVIAKSGSQLALDWASGDVAAPDLLLTDFDLEDGSNGLTLAADLTDVLGVAVPTIILTGDITTATLNEIKATAFHQVVKPVMPEVLLALISDLMLKARAAREKVAQDTKCALTTVHVIDDDPVIRETMRRLFQAEGWTVATHASAEDFLTRPRPSGVGCMLVDNLLPGMTGVQLIAQLYAERVVFPAIMLTGHGDATTAVAAMKAGAFDLIEKPASAAELLTAVRLALKSVDHSRPHIETQKAARKRFSGLTKRENEVLAHVLKGAPNKIIAADLGLNQRTVESHRASVMRKVGVRSLAELVRMAFAADLDARERD